jgi:hypothetical protein
MAVNLNLQLEWLSVGSKPKVGMRMKDRFYPPETTIGLHV